MKIVVTDFAKRQFKSTATGTRITSHTPEEFEECINMIDYPVESLKSSNLEDIQLLNHDWIIRRGYADFCSLLFIPNFTNASVSSLEITLTNYQYLRSGYHARTPQELPVLSRWFELPLPLPKAKYLMVILYDKAHLDEEERVLVEKIGANDYAKLAGDYGIVSIMAIDTQYEEPMSPITMMRNALGMEEGGSGVPLDKSKYEWSVEYWKTHAIVKS